MTRPDAFRQQVSDMEVIQEFIEEITQVSDRFKCPSTNLLHLPGKIPDSEHPQ